MSDADYTSTSRSVFNDEKVMPILVHALYLLGFVTGGVSTLVGVVLAYVGLSENDWRRSHYLYAIYTFWLTLAAFAVAGAVFLVGVPLSFIIVGIPLVILGGLAMGAVTIWFGVRSVLALVYALRADAYPRPRSFIV